MAPESAGPESVGALFEVGVDVAVVPPDVRRPTVVSVTWLATVVGVGFASDVGGVSDVGVV